MPTFLVEFDAGTGTTSLIRQRSATNYQATAKILPDEIMVPRTTEVNGVPVQWIFCGECYDRRLYTADTPKVGIIIGHWTMNRIARSMRLSSELGFTLLNAEHRTTRYGMSFCFRNGKDLSHRHERQIELNDGLWAELAVFEVGERGEVRNISNRVK